VKDNIILDKSFAFSVRVVRAYQHVTESKREYILTKQLLRAATSIGANVHEANNAQGKRDFIAKMYIAYKEASETEYWIKLLTETDYFTDAEGKSLLADCIELKQILTAILRSAKNSV
jgi:four helix bundle protein